MKDELWHESCLYNGEEMMINPNIEARAKAGENISLVPPATKHSPFEGGFMGMLCFVFLLFISSIPAHAYWGQTDWSGGDSQCLWVYDAARYDTAVNIDDTCVINSDTCISIVNAGATADVDTGVLLSSTFDASSLAVWKTIRWNDPSSLTDPDGRGDSRLRKNEVGLVGLWHFDEGENLAGGTSADAFAVYDESTNYNTGVVHGSFWEQASDDSAVFQSALYFDGLGGYVDVPSSTSLSDDITDAITIEAWVNSLSSTASSSTVYEFNSDGSDTDKWGWRCDDKTGTGLVPGTETALDDTALATVAADDASYDEAADSNDIKYHRFKFTIGEPEAEITRIKATWVAQDEHTSYTSYLYIWDFDGTQWVQIASFTNDGQKHTYEGELTADLTKYVDGSGFLYVLGASCNPGPSRWLRTHYVKVEVSYGVDSYPEKNISKDGSYGIGATLTTAAAFINGQTITSAVSPGWNHIALTYDTTDKMKLYVNGTETVTYDTTLAIVQNSNSFKIGQEFNGLIDEVAVYSRAKTADEIWQDSRGTQVRFRTQTTSSILSGDPVGLWHFDNLDDDPVSTTAHDSSIYDNDGELKDNAAWSQNGVFGKCLYFDGTGDYVEIIPHSASLVSSGNITVEAWVKSEADGVAQGIVGKLVSSSSSGFLLNKAGTNKFSFSVGDGKLLNNIASGIYVADTGWHHVAGVIRGNIMYLYVDGVQKNSKSLGTSPIVDSDGYAYIGKSYSDSSASFFNGYIDEVGIYNYAKLPKQIAIDARGGQPWSPWSHSYYKKGDEDDVVIFKDDFHNWEKNFSGWTELSDALSWANSTDWYTYEVETEISLSTEEGDASGGILLNWNETGGNYGYIAVLDDIADELRLYEMDTSENIGTLLDSYAFSSTIDPDTWYTLKAQYDGSNIKVYVEDTLRITTPVSITYKGYAGMIAESGLVYYNYFKVHPIDRYIRYEATLTDNVNNDTTPYLYWVISDYEDIAEGTLWSIIWQDKYGLHRNNALEDVIWAPEDQEQSLVETWSVLDNAEIDSADTVWCYNLENYDFDYDHNPQAASPDAPDGGLRVFVEVPRPATDYVNLKFGYRTALTTPVTWPPNETDYTWDDGDGWMKFPRDTVGVCDIEYTGSDTEVWKCTFTETQINDNFSKEAGYILWAQAESSGGNTEEDPAGFALIDGDRADTSIIYMMKDITPPGSTNASGGWPWQVGQSGYQPVAGRYNDNWIGTGDGRLKLKGIESSTGTDVSAYRFNSGDIWINYNSQDDSGILVSVEDKNSDPLRVDDCSGLKEKAFDDSPSRYVYSTKAYEREWRHPDYVIDITDIDEWAECDTDWDNVNEIRYLALGKLGSNKPYTTSDIFDNPMPNLETMSSKEGRDILIQFAQKDKAGNWGYSHPNYDHYYANSSVGYYINYDITKPIPRIISAPREANYSGSASFGFDDNSADDSTLFCAFAARLERNDNTDKTLGTYTVVTGYDGNTYQPWLPVSDKSFGAFSGLITSSPAYWYCCSVKARDEALNVSDGYDTYYFQCLAPVPNTIIYSAPTGIITSPTSTYSAIFKFRGEGGTAPYTFSYSLDGNAWSIFSATSSYSDTLDYGNHTFRVKAMNNSGSDPDDVDSTPASVTFTIESTTQPSAVASPSDPVKYWREESE